MNNIENKIKNEFNNRTIEPSVNSWNVLNLKLKSVEKTKKNKKYFYFKIAVVFIGLVTALSVLLINDKSVDDIDNVVKINPRNIEVKTNKSLEITDFKEHKEVVKYIDKEEDELIINKKTTPKKVVVKTHQKPKVAMHLTNNTSVKEKQIEITKSVNYSNKLIVGEVKSQKILSVVKAVEKKKTVMNSSDDDIDNMLDLAMGNKIITSKKIKVNSKSLIYSVENELSKKKMHHLIKAGVDTVESIIVSRNE